MCLHGLFRIELDKSEGSSFVPGFILSTARASDNSFSHNSQYMDKMAVNY